jgi:hypothetical protein
MHLHSSLLRTTALLQSSSSARSDGAARVSSKTTTVALQAVEGLALAILRQAIQKCAGKPKKQEQEIAP